MPTAAEYAAAYRKGAQDLRNAVKGMTREQLIARPIAGQWSTLECVCHLADFEPVYVERFKRTLTYDNPTLYGADEKLFAKDLYYQDRDVNEELAVVEATRNAMARILEKLTPAHLARTAVHNERGPMTLEKLIQTITGHIPHHLKFIAEKRKALGV